jgi:hypothetical protein
MPSGFRLHQISARQVDAVCRLPREAEPFTRDFRANEEFHVEAKKPHGDIATPDNYFQTIRSALTAEEIKIVEGQV